MNVDINAEINTQLDRCKALADDAAEDSESPLSQRAAVAVGSDQYVEIAVAGTNADRLAAGVSVRHANN